MTPANLAHAMPGWRRRPLRCYLGTQGKPPFRCPMAERLPPVDRRQFGGFIAQQLLALVGAAALPWWLKAGEAQAQAGAPHGGRHSRAGKAEGNRMERKVNSQPQPTAQPKTLGSVILVKAGADHLAQALTACPKGSHLSLEAGEHAGDLTIDKSVTLSGTAGAGAVIVRGSGRGPVLRVDDDGLAIRLQDLTLTGGIAEAGGGVAVFGRGTVALVNCVFTENQGGMVGGGGLYARAGFLQVEGCRFVRNTGRQGGAVMLDMAMKAELQRCHFEGNHGELGGALRIAEGADVLIKAGHFKGNVGQDAAVVRASGTRSRQPKVLFEFCDVDGGKLVNGPEIAANITLKNCKVPSSWKTVAGVTDGGGNTWKVEKPA